jgi:phosphatidylinositol-3-phosphatase
MREPGHLIRSLVAAVVPLAASGCSSAPNDSGNTSVACRALTTNVANRSPDWRGTVFTIVMENHSRDQIMGNASAPFINRLAQENALAAGYHDSYVHPSEPNYLWMVAGENFGILNDDDPGPSNTVASRSHIADQIERAGLTWRTYQESMGQPCGLRSHDTYAVKHNPFAYFDDINGWNGASFEPSVRCNEHIVDYAQLDVDLAANSAPDYVFITPDLTHDMHDGSVADGDAWLAREVPKILASDACQNGGVLFVLWDEGNDQGDDPPFIAVSPGVKHGYVSRIPYDTSAFLLTVQNILGVEALPCSPRPDSVQPMTDLFTVPLSASSAAGDGG